MNGTLLWFNGVKEQGLINTEEGERLFVHGSAFAEGKLVAGRCKGLLVSFEIAEGAEGRRAAEVSLIPQVVGNRARLRGRGATRS